MKERYQKGGIIRQVTILFALGIVATGILTYGSFSIMANRSVKEQTREKGSHIAEEIKSSIEEYPAYPWLLKYWYENADQLEIEYDVTFDRDTLTAEKTEQFLLLCPELMLDYVTEQELSGIPEEAGKLYAEIAYSRLITRLDEIKQAYDMDYLFCVVTDESCKEQFFLLSAADPGAVRGTNYQEVYPLGMTVSVNESQQQAMRSAIEGKSFVADAGDFVDCYYTIGNIGEDHVLVGMTYNIGNLKSDIQKQAIQNTLWAMLFQIVLSAMCLDLLLVFVLHPLRRVQKRIRRYKEDKDSKAVRKDLMEISPGNEIGQLSEDVIELAAELEDYMEKITAVTAEKERISTELSLATKIQAAMLPGNFPAFPERDEFDIYAGMTPAKEVGGDFYDFFLIDDDHLGLVMADVSGKGVPAALFMMASKILIQTSAMTGKSPAGVLKSVNDQICAYNREEMFVTVWFGILTISTGRIVAANAGHEYPIIKRGDGDFELLRDKHGFVIGGMEDMEYKEYEFFLEKGDVLFLYTDGVPEATNAENVLFGTERMLDTLNKNQDTDCEGILKAMRADVDAFVGDAPQFDDLTMLAVKITK